MDSLTRSTWNNRVERVGGRDGAGGLLCCEGRTKQRRNGRDGGGGSSHYHGHWYGKRTAWAGANERSGVTAEQVQRSAVLRGGSEWTRAAGSEQRGMQQGSAEQRAMQRGCVVGMGGEHAEERERAGRPDQGDCASFAARDLHFLLACYA